MDTAAALVRLLALAFPDRVIHVVADAAYHGPALRTLPGNVTWTCRIPRNAVLYDLAPPRTGRRGRPRSKGDRLGTAGDIAATASWATVTVTAYGREQVRHVAEIRCLWYGSWHTRAVRLILSRDEHTASGYDLGLVTTDPATSPGAWWPGSRRWRLSRRSLMPATCWAPGRPATGSGLPSSAPSRSPCLCTPSSSCGTRATATTRPTSTTVAPPSPGTGPRRSGPSRDMVIKLRRTLIAARFSGSRPAQPTSDQIRIVLAAWD